MGALTSQAVTTAGITPSAVSVSASDTIAEAQMGPNGCIMRVINAGGSPDNVSVTDPGSTALGNAGTVVPVAVANGTTKEILIPRSALNSSGQATVAHSFITSVTCELKRI